MLRECCCGCSLRTGCFILAYLNMILVVVGTIAFFVLRELGHEDIQTQESDGAIVSSVISSAIIIVFTWGVHNENWVALVPYIFMSVMETITLLIASLILCFVISPVYLVLVLLAAIYAYFTSVVWSYAIELKRGFRSQPSAYNQSLMTSQCQMAEGSQVPYGPLPPSHVWGNNPRSHPIV